MLKFYYNKILGFINFSILCDILTTDIEVKYIPTIFTSFVSQPSSNDSLTSQLLLFWFILFLYLCNRKSSLQATPSQYLPCKPPIQYLIPLWKSLHITIHPLVCPSTFIHPTSNSRRRTDTSQCPQLRCHFNKCRNRQTMKHTRK